MIIANRKIGSTATVPYIIAEISGNHGGSFKKAKELISAAKWAGADAVKTQCYEPDTITLDCSTPDFIMQDGLWRGKKLHDLYEEAHTPFAWHRDLYNFARDCGITIFSSVFDKSSVDLCEGLGAPAYKIASFEIVDIPLIEYVASTGKPIIMSTGMASADEIEDAVLAATTVDTEHYPALLHCTSEYPGTVEHASLNSIFHLQNTFPMHVSGLSDHTEDSLAAVLATAMGIGIIEKHLKLEDTTSEDDSFSLTPEEFSNMVNDVRQAHEAMLIRQRSVNPSRQARRSLYAVKEIKKGDVFTEDNIRSIRPGYGLPPKDLPKLLGTKAKRAFRRGERLTWKF